MTHIKLLNNIKIKGFNDFINEDKKTLFNYYPLLKGVKYEKIDLDDYPFYFDLSLYGEDYSLDMMNDNAYFNRTLHKNGYFAAYYVNTKFYKTYLTSDIKYILVYKKGKHDKDLSNLTKIMDPSYMVLQTKDINGDWKTKNIKAFKIIDRFYKFYKNISSMTIELIDKDSDKSYIYDSNGDMWVLKNVNQSNDMFKKVMSNDDINNALKNDNIEIKMID
jgi:hypothetical protein